MSELTRILSAIDAGDPHAAGQLLPLVYDELRKLAAGYLANEAPGHTLDATALVHEAYLRLIASQGRERPEDAPRFADARHSSRRRRKPCGAFWWIMPGAGGPSSAADPQGQHRWT
jgi:hypothetical protein